MLAVMLMLAAPQAATPSLFAAAQGKLSAATVEPAAPDRRYRIDAEATVDDDKERALGTTGEQCNVVGARRCTKKPRTWLKAPIGG